MSPAVTVLWSNYADPGDRTERESRSFVRCYRSHLAGLNRTNGWPANARERSIGHPTCPSAPPSSSQYSSVLCPALLYSHVGDDVLHCSLYSGRGSQLLQFIWHIYDNSACRKLNIEQWWLSRYIHRKSMFTSEQGEIKVIICLTIPCFTYKYDFNANEITPTAPMTLVWKNFTVQKRPH